MFEEKASYASYRKPAWAPPAWLFGPVWTALYLVIAFSFGAVFIAAGRGDLPMAATIPFVANLVFNALFTPLQFGLRSRLLASIDILLVLGTLVWAIATIYPLVPWVAYAQIPYLAWVSFATILQLTVARMNP